MALGKINRRLAGKEYWGTLTIGATGSTASARITGDVIDGGGTSAVNVISGTLSAAHVGSGEILLQGRTALPPGDICLVSLARSGDSPESVGVVQLLLDSAVTIRS